MNNRSFTLKKVTDKTEWEHAVTARSEANFLQSWNWGEFHTALEKNVERWLVSSEGTTVALYQTVLEKAKRGSYLTVAGGPLLDWSDTELAAHVVEQLKKSATEQQAVFIRFRPQVVNTDDLAAFFRTQNIIKAPMHLTADLTLQLDLTLSDEEILKNMRKNTRYDVKKAEKLGIQTSISTDPEDIKNFYDIQCDVAKRHNFVPFSYTFFYEQFKAFAQDNLVALISSSLDGKLLAQAFVIFYNKEAVYHYGISTDDNAHLPGSYACQWYAIQEAKRRGCVTYNFWGIAPHDQPEHRFAGVSLFKRGFGGVEVEYVPAHDIPCSSMYTLTSSFEKLRKWKRKL